LPPNEFSTSSIDTLPSFAASKLGFSEKNEL
jgi:hypothetical protein